MNRKLDFPALLLFTALLFGVVIRFYPAIANGFPLNDGGMFYTMVQDLKANGYGLPQFTTYNHADIPFAYPPFGFYIGAALSNILPRSDLLIFLYLPALINTISVLIFYLFAKETLDSRATASLATMIYALSPRAFVWQVMGGGITRAFGMLFLLMMLWQAVKLFRSASHLTQQDHPNREDDSNLAEKTRLSGATHPQQLILTILFGAGAVLSHPQTALHAALGGGLIFIFYGLNKRGLTSALFTGLGVALLTAPWWVTVLSRYGLGPFISAGQTSQRTLETYLGILKFDGLGDYLFIPTLLLAIIGMWTSFKRKEFFLITWAMLAYLIDPRGGEGIALLSLSMLAGMGLLKFLTWISRSDNEQGDLTFLKRMPQVLLFGLIFYLVMSASIFDFQLINTSLKTNDLEMIEWVKSNVEDGKTFLLATGREFSMSDPMQEWFPALTEQYSATTMQGLEWTLDKGFFPWYDQLIAFQHCSDVSCVSEWSSRNDVDYDYLIVTIPPENDESELAVSLRGLATSIRSSALHLLVYESKSALVFELSK